MLLPDNSHPPQNRYFIQTADTHIIFLNCRPGVPYMSIIKIRSFRSLLKDLTESHIKVKSGDLSIMHDHNVAVF